MTARRLGKAYILALSLAIVFWADTASAQSCNEACPTTIATPGTFLNTGPGTNIGGDTVSASQYVALQFTLSDPAAITEVQGYFGAFGTSGTLNVVIRTDNETFPTYPVPGTAIWSQTYSFTAPSTTSFVTFSNYLAVLAAGTYWVSFEPPVGSTVNVGMYGPATNPATNSAFYDGGTSTWFNFNFGGNHSTSYPAATVSGYDLGTASGAPLLTFGTFARTITQGTVFNTFPFSQNLAPVGNVGQADTLQWNIYSPAAVANAYGTISANPKTQGDILTAGAYSGTGTNDSGAARGIVFSTYLNTTGKDIPNVQANAALSGSILGAGSNSPVTVSAAVYVFDPAAFTNFINSVVPSGFPSVAQFLLGGNNLAAGIGSYYTPDLGQLFPEYVDDSWDSNNASQFPLVCTETCPSGYEVSTAGFELPANALFTVMFDVTAASQGAAGAQSLAIGDFLSTLQPDLTNGFFTDGNPSVNNGLGNPISGIVGPIATILAVTPANIVLSPGNQSIAVGSTAVVTAAVTDASDNPIPNAIVRFAITSGPHSGFTGPVGTDSNGNATLTFTDTLGTAGTDVISASIGSLQASPLASIDWTSPGPIYTITLSPQGASVAAGTGEPYTAMGSDYFSNPLGDVTSQLTFSITPDGACTGSTCTPALSGPHTVTGSYTNPVVGNVSGTASLTVTSNSLTTPTITFGAAPTPTYLGGNFMVSATTNSNGALTYSYVSGPCTQVSGGTFSSTGAGLCVVQANTAATSTYSAGSAQQSVTISPATPTITFGAAPSPTYLGGNFNVSATTNSDGALTYSYMSGPCAQVSGGTFSSSGAGTCVVKASTAATTNFNAGSTTQNVIISMATPTITFGAAPSPRYLGGNFNVSATTNSDGALTYSYMSGPCAQVSGGAFSSSGAGTCVVKASTAATTNFAAGSTTQNVIISAATPTITFGAAPSPTYLGGNFTVSATTNSNGALTYSYVSGPCAQVSGGTFSSTGGGVCVIQASVAVATNFTAGSATQNVTISPATPTITFSAAPSATYPGSNFTVSATTNSNGALTYTYVSGPCAQVSGGTFSPSGVGSCVVQASTAATTNFLAGSRTQSVSITAAGKTNPIITWPTPAPITYGTPLSSTQLDATANVAGTFVYNPPAKTILTAGMHTLSVTFTPTKTTAYNTVTAMVNIQVNQAVPPVVWIPVPTVYGIPLGPLQLDALTPVPGTFAYNPPAGTILHAGKQTLSATFTPKDTTDYETITVHATLVVAKAVPDVDWSQPASITVGTPLSAKQLDATANVTGTFVYNPPAGTILPAGTTVLKVTFTPTDTTDYTSATAQVVLTVLKK